MTDRTNPPLLLFWLSAFGSLVSAVVFTWAHHLTLPASDLAHGQPVFGHPLVGPLMFMGAVVATLAVFPLASWLMRRVDLRVGFWVVLGFALAGAGGVTLGLGAIFGPLSVLGIPAAIALTVQGMLFCRKRFPF